MRLLSDGRFNIRVYPAGEIVPGLQVMDAVRVFDGFDDAGESVQAELFPEISIGDAPALKRS